MPKAGEASRTALMVAAYRARASAMEPAVCDDPWAGAFAGEEGDRFAEDYLATFRHMDLWIGVRTAFIDAHVRRFVAEDYGFDQVVVLGAGFDSRAARLAVDGVRYFEVDIPASSRLKRELAEEIEGYPADAATYVECDFERDDFVDRLVAEGFDASRPAFFIWEGVSYYLSEGAVRATASKVAHRTHEQSALIFDYMSKRFVRRETNDEAAAKSLDVVEGMGEPFLWGTNDPLPLLYDEGFHYARMTRFDEACLMLTGVYDRAHQFRFQGFALASRTAPWIG